VFRWVQELPPLLIDAAPPCPHCPRGRWFMHESYVKLVERWVSPYWAIDQFGRGIDMLVSQKRDMSATRWFFTRVLTITLTPVEATTDKVAGYPRVREELAPGPDTAPTYATNRIEADHGRLTSRPRPIRGVKQLRRERVATTGNTFIQSVAAATTNSALKEPSIPQLMIKTSQEVAALIV
ncbi:MAG: DDE-type integrase/transposase/recombinase, partial [Pseudonocardiaceae bacterium]